MPAAAAAAAGGSSAAASAPAASAQEAAAQQEEEEEPSAPTPALPDDQLLRVRGRAGWALAAVRRSPALRRAQHCPALCARIASSTLSV